MGIFNSGRHLKRIPTFICFAFLLPTASFARNTSPSPEAILAEASRYTAKIRIQIAVGLNADTRGDYSGTGFLIDKQRGWFLTNAHVASRSPSKISLSFKGGDPIPARRVFVDAFMDVAVLAVAPDRIPKSTPVAQLDCKGLPSEGASVFAYGHPWGLDFTASRGIVSGVSWFPPQRLIQTDASINQGNSGGPLIRVSDGKVVGVSSHSYKDDDDENAIAVGLAQPLPPICHILDLMRQGRDPSTRLLPVDLATDADGLRPTVASVDPSAPDFRPGDRIIGIEGSGPISEYPEMFDLLRGQSAPVRVKVNRNGQEVVVTSPLRAVPDPLAARALNISGMILSAPWRIDNREVDALGHLIVVDTDPDRDQDAISVGAGLRLKYVNGQSFMDMESLHSYLAGLENGANVEMIFWRPPNYEEFSGGNIVVKIQKSKLEWVSAQE